MVTKVRAGFFALAILFCAAAFCALVVGFMLPPDEQNQVRRGARPVSRPRMLQVPMPVGNDSDMSWKKRR
jgi:hypothetical protein